MELTLSRKIFNETSTEGNLSINGKWFCDVLEDRVRAEPGEWKPECKIKGQTAIAYGRYQVLVTWSNKFKRMLTQIMNVPDFEGIRIHNGTTEKNTEGCVLVSYHDDDINHRLFNEKTAMNDLCNLIEATQKNEKIFINIVKAEDFKKLYS